MFWREQALVDERFDPSLPTFWRQANVRVPRRCFLGGAESPGASHPPPCALSITGDICLFPSLSLLKRTQPAAGRMSRLGTGGDSRS